MPGHILLETVTFEKHNGPPGQQTGKTKLTATFEAVGRKTKLTWRMLFEFAAERDRVKAYAINANEQNLDRLEAQLAKIA